MKRFIVVECDTETYSTYIWLHEGDSVCATLIGEEAKAFKAVPLDDVVGASCSDAGTLTRIACLLLRKRHLSEVEAAVSEAMANALASSPIRVAHTESPS